MRTDNPESVDFIMKKFLTIGLTGPTGAGKSTLRALVEEFGCEWLDCDIVAREVVEPGQPALLELAEHFGNDIIRADGSLDRGLLAGRAFPTEEGRNALNSITHPRVLERLGELSERAFERGRHVIIDAPLLFEGGVDKMCDTTAAVLAPPDMRLNRIMARDGISEEQARLRMNAQPEDEFYRSRAEYVLYNNAGRQQLLSAAREVFRQIFASLRSADNPEEV